MAPLRIYFPRRFQARGGGVVVKRRMAYWVARGVVGGRNRIGLRMLILSSLIS